VLIIGPAAVEAAVVGLALLVMYRCGLYWPIQREIEGLINDKGKG